jgi:hypothetical protein
MFSRESTAPSMSKAALVRIASRKPCRNIAGCARNTRARRRGHSNTIIAARLQLSQKTIRNNVSNILAKLQVADRAQAIVRARDAGLGQQSRG